MSKFKGWLNKDSLKIKGLVEQPDGSYKPAMLKKALSQREMKNNPVFNPAENKKVRNAVKTTENGVTFDSRLEKYMYDLLKFNNIPFEFQKTYCLQESFEYLGKRIRPITLTVDFLLPQMIIDTKGYANDVSPLKHKLLKYYLMKEEKELLIYLPSNKEECNDIIHALT